MTLQRYEKKYSDTFSECDLSQTEAWGAKNGGGGKVVFYTSKHTKLSGISIQTLYWYTKLYIILAGALAYWCLPHQKINTVDRREIYCREKSSSRERNLLQTSKKRRERFFLIEQITQQKRYWIIFKPTKGMEIWCSSHLFLYAPWRFESVLDRRRKVNRVIIHVESVTLPIVSLSLQFVCCSVSIALCHQVERLVQLFFFVLEGLEKGNFRNCISDKYLIYSYVSRFAQDFYRLVQLLLTWLMALSKSLNYSCWLFLHESLSRHLFKLSEATLS